MVEDPAEVAAIADPAARALAAAEHVKRHQRLMNEFARIRREAIGELRSVGMSHAQVAMVLGVTRARAAQLVSAGPPAERAFLGRGVVTIAIPLRDDPALRRPVLAAEDVEAANALANLCHDLGLETAQHSIAPGGRLPMPTEDLVVICGPKSSEDAARLLAEDPWFTYGPDEHGVWRIVERDTGVEHRSPMDTGASDREDIAYLARRPRPDGRGTLLHIAGVHALGSVGATHFLEQNLAELYRDLGTRPFSMVVASAHEPGGVAAVDSRALVPPRRA